MDYRLEMIVLPVTDPDRSKHFYAEVLGWNVDVDHEVSEQFRVIQLTPPGSDCSVTIGRGMADPAQAGNYKGMHLCVRDIAAAREELVARGAPVGELFHFGAEGQADGLHPTRAKFGTYCEIVDPDGNQWLLQEVNDNPSDPPP